MLLQVIAQDPYLQAENNTGLSVQRGGLQTFTSANLSVISNLDIRAPEEVSFEVFLPPKHGVIYFRDGEHDTVKVTDPVTSFTQRDLVLGRVAYQHNGDHELLDWFNVTVRVQERSSERRPVRGRREVHLDVGVLVNIYLKSHHKPPLVINNRPVMVTEGEKVSLSREQLEVMTQKWTYVTED